MNSTEKLLAFLEQLDDRPDAELAQMFPLPPALIHMAVSGAAARVPGDHVQLDEWAAAAAEFCLSMRSDDAPEITLAGAGVEALTAAEEPA